MTVNYETRIERVRASFWGAIVGDALGSPNEFNPVRVLGPKLRADYTGRWTDDTQLSLLVIDSFGEPVQNPQSLLKDLLGTWYKSPLGGHRAPGGACMQAASQYSAGNFKWWPDPDSLGSGAIMRAHIYGLVCNSPDEAERLAIAGGRTTHGELAALLAGQFAAKVNRLVMGLPDSPRSDSTRAYLAENVEGCEIGWDTMTAMRFTESLFDHTPDAGGLVQLLIAAGHPGDSDTLGCMTGALVGAKEGQMFLDMIHPFINKLDLLPTLKEYEQRLLSLVV